VSDFAKVPAIESQPLTVDDFINLLPNILKGRDFKELVSYIAEAAKNGRIIAVGIGGHVIKCGLALELRR